MKDFKSKPNHFKKKVSIVFKYKTEVLNEILREKKIYFILSSFQWEKTNKFLVATYNIPFWIKGWRGSIVWWLVNGVIFLYIQY